jgi:hypothetical protein
MNRKKTPIQLPLWLPVDAWEGYIEMRRRIRKPLTEYGKKLALNRLEELAAQGHTPSAVLEQSIFNSWQGLFEVRVYAQSTRTESNQPRPTPEMAAKARERVGQRQSVEIRERHRA